MKKNSILLIYFAIISCGNHEKQTLRDVDKYLPDSSAVKLNNKAVKLIGKISSLEDSLNFILFDSAIIYLDQAIRIDSLYLMAYTNKSQLFRKMGLLEKSLEVLNTVQKIKPGFAEVIVGQGFLLEKLGKGDLAFEKYKQALEAYRIRLRDDPTNIKIQSDIAFIYIFLEDQNRGIDEIQNLILEYPDNQELKAMEVFIKGFDREKFIEEY